MLRVLLWMLDADLVCFILLISDNQIGPEGAASLAGVLPMLTSLTVLNLEGKFSSF